MSGSLTVNADPTAKQSSMREAFSEDEHTQTYNSSFNSSESMSVRRPGPRPTTKPASNPKLQRNREVQRCLLSLIRYLFKGRKLLKKVCRSYRERKERYIKDLEYNAARLKQHAAEITKERDTALCERDALARANQTLREEIETLKSSIGSVATFEEVPNEYLCSDQHQHTASSNVHSVTSETERLSLEPSTYSQGSSMSEESKENFPEPLVGTLDYDAIALDFVLRRVFPIM